jgi:4-amino-4-deoxy-L-arabinose transferase-like glycosyltransferase
MSILRSQQTGSRNRFLAEPQAWLALLICAQLVFWTLVPWLLAISLPLDVVSDGLSWGHEWQWGYYKHPPLPSWTVELFFDALGDLGPFLLSQIAIGATYVFVFLLGREIMDARRAAVGTLLLTGIYYFSIPTPEFNHNVAQMPIWAAASFFYFKAWKTRQLRWWLALGLAAGLGLLTKYPTALLLATMVIHLASTRKSRSAFLSPGPYVAIAICIAVVSPHLVWLYRSGFQTLHYAVVRGGNA